MNKVVRLLQPVRNLMPGEVAGFSSEFADRLIARGQAVAYQTRELRPGGPMPTTAPQPAPAKAAPAKVEPKPTKEK